MKKPNFMQTQTAEEFEAFLDRVINGELSTGSVETDLRMAVATIREMPNIPKDYAVQPLMRYLNKQVLAALKDVKSKSVSTFIAPTYGVRLDAIEEIERKFN